MNLEKFSKEKITTELSELYERFGKIMFQVELSGDNWTEWEFEEHKEVLRLLYERGEINT